MSDMERKTYETPVTEVYEIRGEGVICQSTTTESYTNGYTYGNSDFNE